MEYGNYYRPPLTTATSSAVGESTASDAWSADAWDSSGTSHAVAGYGG